MEEGDMNKTPPVRVGDVIEDQLCINDGKKNDGVVKYEGYIIFVENAKKGDTVSFEITKVMPKFGIAKKLDDDDKDEDEEEEDD